MERKRRLPARAAARVEQASKRRHSTPREPSPEPAPTPPVEETPPPPPLPQSVEAGKPLPTVEVAQPADLDISEYQSIIESGVLTESLSRSRHTWIHEGLFEKYWTKPHKRKGVMHEDPKNPPKESMSKVGTVTITIEPHIIEATMFVVKDPKPPRSQGQTQQKQKQQQQPQKQTAQPRPQPQTRPIIQYGPPGGSMPPPATPATPATSTTSASAAPSPAPEPAASKLTAALPPVAAPSPTSTPAPSPAPAQGQTQKVPSNPTTDKKPPDTPKMASAPTPPARTTATPSPAPSYPPRPPSVPPASMAQTPPTPGSAPGTPAPGARPLSRTPSAQPAGAATTGAAQKPSGLARPAPAPPSASGKPSGSSPAPPAKPTTNDPVIALLAQRASGDPELRDLMKRVAVGQAKQEELNHFQSIINQLNAEYKRGGGQQGPSADRLLVDGRTVRYFADEVCAILDIVLASNPNQKASDLRPPPRSDSLVVLLVKTALGDERTKAMCRRIATGKPGFTDATDLKDILDRLHRESKTTPLNPQPQHPTPPAKQTAPPQATNALANGQQQNHPPAAHGPKQLNPQALRSKGPPPAPKPDVSAVLFDFGTGDRYLFPKYSILEYLPAQTGQKVLASFLIVRKGSTSEYGGDPKLDYYQPVTMHLSTSTGRHLENLARVVAPQDEVRRYMDDVMDNMTRAEYILLAMRLPRAPKEEEEETPTPSGRGSAEVKKSESTAQPIKAEPEAPVPSKPPVLWKKSPASTKTADTPRSVTSREAEEETQAQYLRLISSVAAKE